MSSIGSKLILADSVTEAVAALTEQGTDGAPLAGGTWIMRAPIRGESQRRSYVAIGRIGALQAVDMGDRQIKVGACVTHARLAASLAELPQCAGLVSAAGNAANPSIRQMATIGGNLATPDFSASDLVPALLCLDAEIDVQTAEGTERLSIERFLGARRSLEPGALLTGVTIPRKPVRAAHIRLPLRKAGDYPVAIVSMSAVLGDGGAVEDIRVAVGSVEPTARRWSELEQQLVGRPLDPDAAYGLAKADAAAFSGRDSVDAPGWYRQQVLPTLVRRATQALLAAR